MNVEDYSIRQSNHSGAEIRPILPDRKDDQQPGSSNRRPAPRTKRVRPKPAAPPAQEPGETPPVDPQEPHQLDYLA